MVITLKISYIFSKILHKVGAHSQAKRTIKFPYPPFITKEKHTSQDSAKVLHTKRAFVSLKLVRFLIKVFRWSVGDKSLIGADTQ